MKKVFMILFAVAPLTAGVMVLQSCGGQGGPAAVNTGGLPAVTAAFKALLPAGQANATYVGVDACASCHNDADNPHFTDWQGTKHAANGVTCERCHGPGSNHVTNPGTAAIQQDPSTANILTLPNGASPTVCAQCHGQISEDYASSAHADLVEKGDPNTPAKNIGSSRCASCHNGVVRVATYDNPAYAGTATDPFTDSPAPLTQAQVNVWAGFDSTGTVADPQSPLGHTAVCVTCHNPHKKTGKLDKDGEEHQIRHETYNEDTAGSSPFANATLLPGGYGANTGGNSTVASFQTLDQVCAQCHNGRGVTPTDAKLATGTSRPSMHDSPQFNMLMGFGAMEEDGTGTAQLPAVRHMSHATAPGQCSHCHMGDEAHSHSFKANAGVACAPCHAVDDAAAKQISVTTDVINKLYSLQQRLRGWAAATFAGSTNAADLWDYTALLPVGDVAPSQTLIPASVKRARHNYYFVIRDASLGVHNYPYTDYMITIANDNLTAAGAPAAALAPMAMLTTEQKKASIMADLRRARLADLHAQD